MISPEVFNFSPSHTLQQSCIKTKTNVKEALVSGDYGIQFHAISLVVPGEDMGDELRGTLNDAVYYKVCNFPIHHFLEPSFMLSFVRKGILRARTLQTWSDVDSCANFECGKLEISVGKDVYQELGLNGQPCLTFGREVAKYDLQQDSLTPGSNFHQRAKWCLEKNPDLMFDWILSWDPHDEEICVSSIAAYLDCKGFKVSQCKQKYEECEIEEVKMPLITEDTELTDLVEWVGIASFNMDCLKESANVSTYATTWTCPEPSVKVHKMTVCSWKGFLSAHQASQVLEEINNLSTIHPWTSITLHGFDDSPLALEDVTSFFISQSDICRIFTSRTPRSRKVK